MPDLPLKRFPADQLKDFTTRVFQHYNVPQSEAELAAEILIVSDLRGIDSHGVARLTSYVGLLKDGRINPRPKIRIVRETPSTATVDGDNGLGLVVGPRANEIAMEKAEKVGTGWVAVRHSHHYGIAGYYVLEALKRNQIGWAMTNTSRIVAPLFGADRMLGTNPIAIAFPGLEEPPVVIDMATSAAAYGKIEMAMRKNRPIPEGWAIGPDGRGTTNPHEVANGGALLPLGSTRELGGHKGYCLSAMVDLLSGPLSGANWGPFTPAFTVSHGDPAREVGIGLGHFFGAMQIEAFLDITVFKRQIDDWIRTMRSSRPAPDTEGPFIPGEPEHRAEQQNRREGIPLIPAVINELKTIAQDTGIPFE